MLSRPVGAVLGLNRSLIPTHGARTAFVMMTDGWYPAHECAARLRQPHEACEQGLGRANCNMRPCGTVGSLGWLGRRGSPAVNDGLADGLVRSVLCKCAGCSKEGGWITLMESQSGSDIAHTQ